MIDRSSFLTFETREAARTNLQFFQFHIQALSVFKIHML